MNRVYVYPWDQLSEGATAIAKRLDTSKIKRKGSRYTAQAGDLLVNWGASDFAQWLREYDPKGKAKPLNRNIETALNKVLFFRQTQGSEYVPHSCEAHDLVHLALRFPVLCRIKVKGMDGDGIVIAENREQLVDAPLYVQLEEKTAEYRVHVGRNKDHSISILGVQRKFIPNGSEADKRIRTSANGCYYVWTVKEKPVELPEAAQNAAKKVFDMFPDLDFGGLDVIYDSKRDKAFVIEINTAPEMTPKACDLYANFFQQFREKEGPQQLDYAGEKLPVGELRDPIEPEPQPVQIEPDMDAFMVWYWDKYGNHGQPLFDICKDAFFAGVRWSNEPKAVPAADPKRIDVV